jgi:hypothetical protein
LTFKGQKNRLSPLPVTISDYGGTTHLQQNRLLPLGITTLAALPGMKTSLSLKQENRKQGGLGNPADASNRNQRIDISRNEVCHWLCQ